jgi:Protein phosphatase 2C
VQGHGANDVTTATAPQFLDSLQGRRVVDPSGHRSLNMTRALGDPEFKEPEPLVVADPSIRHTTLK